MSKCVESGAELLPISPSVQMSEQGLSRWYACEKPTGFATRSQDLLRPGLQKVLEQHLSCLLAPLYELDVGVSGVVVFGTEKKPVQLEFVFLTDRRGPANLDKTNGIDFRLLRTLGPFFIWQATCLSSEIFKLPVLARDLGIAILGDKSNGGTPHLRKFLHAQTARFTKPENVGEINFQATEPWWLQQEPRLNSLGVWREAIENRRRLFNHSIDETLRWSNFDVPDWTVEAYGSRVLFSHFATGNPSTKVAEVPTFPQLQQLAAEFGRTALYRPQPNREKNKGQMPELQTSDSSPSWTAREEGVSYELRQDQGQSLGLFLDQRGNRLWVKRNSSSLAVLNLFCYTGGFSVNAALGGASRVTSVDVSKKYLDWTKRNFELNSLSVTDHSFSAMDSQKFLGWARKKEIFYDLIICDPPTFGRSDEGVFQIEKDFHALLQDCLNVLAPNGRILFCNNYEKWTYDQWETRLRQFAREVRPAIRIARGPAFALDCEIDLRDRAMKSFLLTNL